MTKELSELEPAFLDSLSLQEDAEWLNSVPYKAVSKEVSVEARMRQEILAFCESHRSLPLEVRANPMTILEMSLDQWIIFHLNVRDRVIEIPVVSDLAIPHGDIHCVIEGQPTMVMPAVRVP